MGIRHGMLYFNVGIPLDLSIEEIKQLFSNAPNYDSEYFEDDLDSGELELEGVKITAVYSYDEPIYVLYVGNYTNCSPSYTTIKRQSDKIYKRDRDILVSFIQKNLPSLDTKDVGPLGVNYYN